MTARRAALYGMVRPAVFAGKSGSGTAVYHYGGDFGEDLHDGNFCMDGLVYPDRTPHTGLKELKNVFRPARLTCEDAEKGRFTLYNKLDFTDLKDYLSLAFVLTADGQSMQEGALPCPSVSPRGPSTAANRLSAAAARRLPSAAGIPVAAGHAVGQSGRRRRL